MCVQLTTHATECSGAAPVEGGRSSAALSAASSAADAADEAFRCKQFDERCIALRYQPIVDYRGHSVFCLEALLDWRKLSNPSIDTEAFVTEVEQTPELSLSLDTFILKSAMQDYQKINALTGYCGAVSVNISPTTLLSSSFRSMAIDEVNAFSLRRSAECSGECSEACCEVPAGVQVLESCQGSVSHASTASHESEWTETRPQLVLEISERQPWASNTEILSAIDELNAAGVQVAVDDFIRGYANFDVLLSQGVRIVKVDKVISDYLLESDKAQVFAEQFWQLASHLRKQVIIEGIEEVEQALRLKDIGYNYFQGYYFCPPTDIEGIVRYLAAQSSCK